MRKRYLQWFFGGISLFVIVGTCRVAYAQEAPAATEKSEEPTKPSPWSPVEAVGLAGPLKQQLNAPILCTLQGEDLFLDQLHEPWKGQARDLIRQAVPHVDHFIAVSE